MKQPLDTERPNVADLLDLDDNLGYFVRDAQRGMRLFPQSNEWMHKMRRNSPYLVQPMPQ